MADDNKDNKDNKDTGKTGVVADTNYTQKAGQGPKAPLVSSGSGSNTVASAGQPGIAGSGAGPDGEKMLANTQQDSLAARNREELEAQGINLKKVRESQSGAEDDTTNKTVVESRGSSTGQQQDLVRERFAKQEDKAGYEAGFNSWEKPKNTTGAYDEGYARGFEEGGPHRDHSARAVQPPVGFLQPSQMPHQEGGLPELSKPVAQISGRDTAGNVVKMGMTEAVTAFHNAFGVPVMNKPGLPKDESRRELRRNLLQEEFKEYMQGEDEDDIVEIADGLGDMVVIITGTCLEYGIPLEAVFAEIMSANMSKLDNAGKPIYRDDGKVIKGPNYRAPNIKQVLFDAGLGNPADHGPETM